MVYAWLVCIEFIETTHCFGHTHSIVIRMVISIWNELVSHISSLRMVISIWNELVSHISSLRMVISIWNELVIYTVLESLYLCTPITKAFIYVHEVHFKLTYGNTHILITNPRNSSVGGGNRVLSNPNYCHYVYIGSTFTYKQLRLGTEC
jgi:hypothetical protein